MSFGFEISENKNSLLIKCEKKEKICCANVYDNFVLFLPAILIAGNLCSLGPNAAGRKLEKKLRKILLNGRSKFQ